MFKDNEEYKDWRNYFFRKYKRKLPFKDYFITDGVIDFDLYKDSSPHIMFLNKEAYDKDHTTYCLANTLRRKLDSKKKIFGKCNNLRCRLFQYSYITSLSKEDVLKLTPKKMKEQFEKTIKNNTELKYQILKRCAYINVIKRDGHTTTEDEHLKEEYEKSKVLLFEQIEKIAPNIVITGNIFNICLSKESGYEQIYPKNPKKKGVVNVYQFKFNKHKCLVFDTPHPSSTNARGVSQSEYYVEFFKAYKEVLKDNLL